MVDSLITTTSRRAELVFRARKTARDYYQGTEWPHCVIWSKEVSRDEDVLKKGIQRGSIESQCNYDHKRRRRAGLRVISRTWGFVYLRRNLTFGQRSGPSHCWPPRPGIEPSTLSAAVQRVVNRAIEPGGVGTKIYLCSGVPTCNVDTEIICAAR